MNQEKCNNEVHWKYLVGMLITVIIYLITKNFGQNQSLVEYISFAATLASLILAVLAIIQSMLFSQNFTSTADRINGATDDLSEKASSFSSASEGILQRLEEVSDHIKVLETIEKNTTNLGKQFEEVFNQGDFSTKSSLVPALPSVITSSDEEHKLIEQFLDTSSISGLMSLYAIKLSIENKQPFALEEINKKIPTFDADYAFGYLVATASFGLINFERENQVINPSWVHPFLNENIEDSYSKRVKEIDEKYPKFGERATKEKNSLAIFFLEKNASVSTRHLTNKPNKKK